jgi:hypothetical protein
VQADGAFRFSLIIPAHNEEELLPRLLDTVDVARARYHLGPQAVEVTVADNASTDATAELARERGCAITRVATRRIAMLFRMLPAMLRSPEFHNETVHRYWYDDDH